MLQWTFPNLVIFIRFCSNCTCSVNFYIKLFSTCLRYSFHMTARLKLLLLMMNIFQPGKGMHHRYNKYCVKKWETLKYIYSTGIQVGEIASVKASFSFHKLISKNTQMTTLYTIINVSLYITFTMICYIRHEYFCKSFSLLSCIRRLTSGGYVRSGLFIANTKCTMECTE